MRGYSMRVCSPYSKCSRIRTIIAFLVFSCSLAPLGVQAQTFTATLRGTVTDSSGSAVPNAAVSLLNEATNVKQQEKLTDSRGSYLLTQLPPGTYRLSVEMTGFRASVHAGIVLQVQQQADLDVVLQVGDVATSVMVAGEAPRLD